MLWVDQGRWSGIYYPFGPQDVFNLSDFASVNERGEVKGPFCHVEKRHWKKTESVVHVEGTAESSLASNVERELVWLWTLIRSSRKERDRESMMTCVFF